jgi:ATP-dependent protease HslVU (ClpYQ) peptidase subunit
MTAVVGAISGGKVFIGSDSSSVGPNGELQLRKDSKVFLNGPYLIGFAGSWRIGQELKYARASEIGGWGHDLTAHMTTHFLPWFRTLLRKPEFDEQNIELLVGIQGHLYHVYRGLQVAEETIGFDACGCGDQVARGAMYSLYRSAPAMDWKNGKCLTMALEAASRFCSDVRGPYTILEI